MEHKRKSLATAISQSQGPRHERLIDRFSNLPEEVAHHILSSLTLRDICRVGCVSKRCMQFYLSTPSLNFDVRTFSRQKRLKLLGSLDRFLSQRGDNKIQHFRIRWLCRDDDASSYYDEYFRVINWMYTAARCNVEVLDLYFPGKYELGRPVLELPSCIFLCQSLRSLMVDLHGDKLLKTPSFACFTTLQCLKLSSVTIDEEFCKWISCSCKCIKELGLESVVGIEKICIESSSLESFRFVPSYRHVCHLNISGEKLENIQMYWIYQSSKLNIFAPNLKRLKWKGRVASHLNLEKVMSLEKAEIFLQPRIKADFGNLFEAFCSIQRVEVLMLNAATMKALFWKGSMPGLLAHVGHFCVRDMSLTDHLVKVMTSLLKRMPNLHTLHVVTSKSVCCESGKFGSKYWKLKNLACINQLKEVTFEISNNGMNEWELARYIIENAKNLKKLFIYYLPNQFTLFREITESATNSPATVEFKVYDKSRRVYNDDLISPDVQQKTN
ncbi:hypothetical protein ACFX2I_008571 [Malus domestica]